MSAPAPVLTVEDVDRWRQAIRRDTFSNYHLEMGMALVKQGEDAAAIGQLRQALSVRPDFPLALQQLHALLLKAGRATEAGDLLQAAAANDPEAPIKAHLAGALFQGSRGNPDMAAQALDAAARLAGDTPALLHVRTALGFITHGAWKPAPPDSLPEVTERTVRGALAELYRDKAMAYVQAQRYEAAVAAFSALRVYAPDDHHLDLHHAVALLGAGRFDAAVDVLDRLAAQPDGPKPDLTLHVRGALAAGRLDRADALVRERPSDPSARTLQGLIAANRGNWREAADLQREAVAAAANEPFARTNLGLALQGLGQTAEAVEAHRAALAIAPDDAWILTNLGLALTAAGQADDALTAHRRAMEASGGLLRYTIAQRRWAAADLTRIYTQLGAFAGPGGDA
ncbi:tetratricopeptide repeat protein [Azospirillum sp. B4]|uniref:tetratricopeptide repeat protein n=1 Tax=Azospirillum sp. B4 TaxID=95605 RepID=UPI00034535FE|nr:tetratricopeptide repeat protein [Azospirillum sp. B4]